MSVLDLIPTKKKKKAPKGFAAPAIKVPRYEPPLIPSQNPVPPRLKSKLLALGRKYRFVHCADRIARYVAAGIMLISAQMFLDWLIDLNFLLRAIMLAGDIWLLVHFGRRQLLPHLLHSPNLEACALMVEKHWPRFKGRMIATVQFAGPRFTSDSPELVRTVQQETDAKTGAINFGDIVPTRALRNRTIAAAAVAILFACVMVLMAPGSLALLERVFLIPAKVPRKTEVICLSGDKIIPAGESVTIEAEARGIIPFHGRATLTDENGRIREITIDPEPDHANRFSLKIEKIDQPLHYTIRLNDGVSDTYSIKTIPRPMVTSIDCEQVYPPYTGLPDTKRTVGNLALLPGSQLKIHAVTNSKVVKASVKLADNGKVIPLTIGGSDGNEITGSINIPTTGLTAFSILLTDQAGITAGDEVQYRIDLVPDHPPTIQLTYPERLQELYTLKAKPTIAFVANDDYGLAKVALCYRIVPSADSTTDSTDPSHAPVNKIDMDLGQGHPLNMKNRYEWDLAAVKPPLIEGTTIEYWMEAQDANNITGPGISESEHHTIKIVSAMEKKAEGMNRLVDLLSTLGDVNKTQEQINQDLGDAIQGKQEPKK